MAMPKVKARTYRVENIPWGTTSSQLIKDYFIIDDQDDLKVGSLYPSVDSPEGEEEDRDLTATVLFRPRVPRLEGPRIQQNVIQVDKNFTGFTPLYVPPAVTGPIAAEYVIHPVPTPSVSQLIAVCSEANRDPVSLPLLDLLGTLTAHGHTAMTECGSETI